METNLDHAANSRAETGRVALHRLNRKEYTNAIRDLLDVDMDPAELLPVTTPATASTTWRTRSRCRPPSSTSTWPRARTVAVAALGNANARPVGTTYTSGGGEQFFHVAGAPPGTRGGIVVTHPFPADGEYVINISNMAQAIWVYNMEFANHLVVSIDRKKIYETTIGGEEDMKAIDQKQDPAVDAINKRLKNIRFRTTAGPHEIAVTFQHRSFAESEDRLQQHVPGGGQRSHPERELVRSARADERVGCQRDAVAPDACSSASRPTPLKKRPARARSSSSSRGAHIAARQPDADVADLMKFYEIGSKDGGFEAGIRQGLTALLADPEFLYRAEVARAAGRGRR